MRSSQLRWGQISLSLVRAGQGGSGPEKTGKYGDKRNDEIRINKDTDDKWLR